MMYSLAAESRGKVTLWRGDQKKRVEPSAYSEGYIIHTAVSTVDIKVNHI
jgi:hypothetical protein